MKKTNSVIKTQLTEEETEYLAIAIEIAKKRRLRTDIVEQFSKEDVSKNMKIIYIMDEVLGSLSLVRPILNNKADNDTEPLSTHDLFGIRRVIDEVYNMLAAAVELHHGASYIS